MLQKIRIFLRYTLAWIVVIGCVSLIGFVLYPLLSEKYNSMALQNKPVYTGGWTIKSWYPLEIQRKQSISGEVQTQFPTDRKTKLDAVEDVATQQFDTRAGGFFQQLKGAFSTNMNKKTVTYTKDTVGVYQGQ